MTPNAVKDKIIDLLEASADLTALNLKKVFESVRLKVSMDDYPCIFVEFIEDEEQIDSVNGSLTNTIRFGIMCFMREYDANSQLTTLFSFETAIKKALSQDVTLGGTAINSRFKMTSSDGLEFYPIRGILLEFDVEYRQLQKQRT